MQPTIPGNSVLALFLPANIQSRKNGLIGIALSAAAIFLPLLVAPSTLAGGCDVPTGSPSSPLEINGTVIEPFTQPMLRFEEFGLQPMPERSTEKDPWAPPASKLPSPDDEYSIPSGSVSYTHLTLPTKA